MSFGRPYVKPERVYKTPAVFAGFKLAAPVMGNHISVLKAEKLKGGKDEEAHKSALSQIGCRVCARLFPGIAPGPVELHHLRTGGWGKGNYRTLIPLCPEHHRGATGVHGLGTKRFAVFYGFDQQDLLNDALSLLAEYKAKTKALKEKTE